MPHDVVDPRVTRLNSRAIFKARENVDGEIIMCTD